jgi:hypothetical protein
MYKVLHTETEIEITILEKIWRERIEELRQMGQQDELVCPVCKQPVRTKAGKSRRWHFAHKHLKNCVLARQSPELLEARAVLYEWLVKQLDEAEVTIEKVVGNLPRPVDVWIQTQPVEAAYWIFDTRYSPAIRQVLREELEGKGILVNWLFDIKLLKEEELFPGWLHLTTTEREFLRTSTLDAASQAAGKSIGSSIHYLDAEKARLISYRGLRLQHSPQRYIGRKVESPLTEITILPETGEFIHLSEISRLNRYKQEAAAAQIRLEKGHKFFKSRSVLTVNTPGESENSATKDQSFESTTIESSPSPHRQAFTRFATCIYCGKQTDDWITYFGKTQECVCRDCQER